MDKLQLKVKAYKKQAEEAVSGGLFSVGPGWRFLKGGLPRSLKLLNTELDRAAKATAFEYSLLWLTTEWA